LKLKKVKKMLQKSTLLSVSIFVLLFIGLSDYGYGCHRGDPHGKDPEQCPDGDEDTTGGKLESIALIMTFDDEGGDNIQSDRAPLFDVYGFFPYIDQEGAGVGASERSQPNPACWHWPGPECNKEEARAAAGPTYHLCTN
jgi:hypothetical protein